MRYSVELVFVMSMVQKKMLPSHCHDFDFCIDECAKVKCGQCEYIEQCSSKKLCLTLIRLCGELLNIEDT
jgi:hypothetical protein